MIYHFKGQERHLAALFLLHKREVVAILRGRDLQQIKEEFLQSNLYFWIPLQCEVLTLEVFTGRK